MRNEKNHGIVLCAAIVGIGWFAVVQFKANIKAQAESEQLVDTLNGTQSQLQQTESTLQKTEDALEQAEGDLAFTKEEKKLLEDTTDALNKQVADLTGKNTNLENKVKNLEKRIKELLHIEEKYKITTVRLNEQISAIAELVTLKYVYTNSSRKEGNLTLPWGWALPFTDSSLLTTYLLCSALASSRDAGAFSHSLSVRFLPSCQMLHALPL